MSRLRSDFYPRFLITLRKIFIDNMGLKLTSLAIAILIWLFVMGAEDVTISVEAPLVFTVPDDKVLVSDVPDKVSIVVSGPYATVMGWNTEHLQAKVNLAKADLGPSVIYVDEKLFSLPPGVKLVRINPSQVSVSLAKKWRKYVPVIPVFAGKPAPGYAVKSTDVSPERIEIEGAASDVQIAEEVLTEEINIADRKESFSVTVKPARLSKNIIFPGKEMVDVTITIRKDLVEKTLDNVPVEVRNCVRPYEIIPSSISVTLMAPRQVLDAFDARQLKAFVDATKEEGDSPGESTREVEFDTLPENVKIKAGAYTVKLLIKEGAHRSEGKHKAP